MARRAVPAPTCPCGREAELVNGAVIYPHRRDLAAKLFYRCAPCGAYVGCHPNTKTPLGTLADAHTRAARAAVHAAFDPLWKSGRWARRDAYGWLANALGIPYRRCHIGLFDLGSCLRAVEVIDALVKNTVRRSIP